MALPFLQLHLAKDAWNSVVCKPAKTRSLKKGRIDHFKPLKLPEGDAWNLTIRPNPPLKKYVSQHVASPKAYQRKKCLSLRREILVAPAWCTSDPIDSDELKDLFLYFFWEEAVEECEVLWDTFYLVHRQCRKKDEIWKNTCSILKKEQEVHTVGQNSTTYYYRLDL